MYIGTETRRLRLPLWTANSLLNFDSIREIPSRSFSKFPNGLIFPKHNVCPDVTSVTQSP
jgi:hypothetical protein